MPNNWGLVGPVIQAWYIGPVIQAGSILAMQFCPWGLQYTIGSNQQQVGKFQVL